MKKCVHCAEEIQDEAALCRHCGRPVPGGALEITHRGGRFGLGKAEGRYSVWDLTTGGPPVAEFEKTDEGWTQAWARYQGLEGSGGQPGAPGTLIVQAAPTNGKAIASLVLSLVGFVIGSILALVLGYQARAEIKASGGRQSGDGLALAGIIVGWVGLAGFIIVLLVFATVTRTSGL